MRHIILATASLATTITLQAQNANTRHAATADNGTTAVADTVSTDSTSTPPDSASYWKQFELGEVSVTAARRLVKDDIDKMTYDMANDEESKTKNTLEMLRKVPLVTVDGQENIKVKGSSDFKIYRNGHPDPALEGENASKILKSMPANAIKKIEVITEPGAKYDAEGTSAILNIVMKENTAMQGLSATVEFRANESGSWQPGANITTQLGKLTLSAEYGFINAKGNTTKSKTHTHNFFADNSEQITDQHMEGPIKIHYGDLSASYEIDSLNLISVSGGGYYVLPGMTGTADEERYRGDGSLDYSYTTTFSTPTYKQQEIYGRADFQHKTRLDGEVLTLSYMGMAKRQDQNVDASFSAMVNTPFGYTDMTQRQHEKSQEQTVQADYVRPLGKVHKMEVGAKYIYRSNKSHTALDYEGDETPGVNSRFNHTTQVAAAYAEWMASVGRWSLRAGLRYEFSHMKAKYPDHSAEAFGKDLNDWCPSASVQYKIDDANSLRANYSTTINRPGIEYLNPARIESPSSISEGAPGLNSSRNQRMGITFTHVGQKLTFSINPSYNFSNNQIGALRAVQDGKTWNSYGNGNRVRMFHTSAYAQANPWTTGTFSVNLGGGYWWFSNPNLDMELGRWNGSMNVNYQQKLPWKLVLALGGGCSFGKAVSSVYAVDGNWAYHYATLQRSFLKDDRLTVQLAAQSPFERHAVYQPQTVQGDYTGWQRNIRTSQQFGVTVSYRFGSLKARVKKADRTIENNDVVGGIEQKGAK